ncbi:MAG TPA: hypothetical protein VLF60_00355 [Candidatus Saccharimonadales bacterium]|nr:hypothetical protein [Candidatus Saccharimonadales bacterium]
MRFALAAIAVFSIGIFTLISHRSRPAGPILSQPAVALAPVQAPAPFRVSPTWPGHVASAAVGASGYGVLATTGQTSPRPTASLAKVITCLAILQKRPLKLGEQGPSIPITAKDEERYHYYVDQNGSVANVQAGTSITERQALEAMLLPSANNIADTSAVWAFGSLDNYRTYASTMLQQMKLTDTKVGKDASGLDPSTTSTAHDLVLLGEIALKNPVIAEIAASKETSDIPVAGVMPNYNRLVTQHGYTGLKLGDSDEAGITLMISTDYTFKGKPVTLVGAVMGADRAFGPQDSTYDFMESVKTSMR